MTRPLSSWRLRPWLVRFSEEWGKVFPRWQSWPQTWIQAQLRIWVSMGQKSPNDRPSPISQMGKLRPRGNLPEVPELVDSTDESRTQASLPFPGPCALPWTLCPLISEPLPCPHLLSCIFSVAQWLCLGRRCGPEASNSEPPCWKPLWFGPPWTCFVFVFVCIVAWTQDLHLELHRLPFKNVFISF